MAKQRLGAKKVRKCEAVTGRSYHSCFVRGGWPLFWAECWYSETDADFVNWKTGEWRPEVRDGQAT